MLTQCLISGEILCSLLLGVNFISSLEEHKFNLLCQVFYSQIYYLKQKKVMIGDDFNTPLTWLVTVVKPSAHYCPPQGRFPNSIKSDFGSPLPCNILILFQRLDAPKQICFLYVVIRLGRD